MTERPGVPTVVSSRIEEYLARVDKVLPGRLEGLHLVGSVAMGAFRENRSDIDFVAVVAGHLDDSGLAALRSVHRRMYLRHAPPAIVRARWPLVCNGVFVAEGDLSRPATAVRPLASQVAREFHVGRAFDVNPVTWWTLDHCAIPVRGRAPGAVPVDEAELREWTLRNLNTYWSRWARTVRTPGMPAVMARLRQLSVWGVLGAPRLHYTIATGEVASKEQAGEYALDVFDRRWHPLIRYALAYWRGEAPPPGFRSPARRRRLAAEFVEEVVASGNALVA